MNNTIFNIISSNKYNYNNNIITIIVIDYIKIKVFIIEPLIKYYNITKFIHDYVNIDHLMIGIIPGIFTDNGYDYLDAFIESELPDDILNYHPKIIDFYDFCNNLMMHMRDFLLKESRNAMQIMLESDRDININVIHISSTVIVLSFEEIVF